MVAYAAKTVPYYRELFEREGIDPREIRGAGDLDRFPCSTADLVRTQPELFLSETPAGEDALTFSTNGTTGTPLRGPPRSPLAAGQHRDSASGSATR